MLNQSYVVPTPSLEDLAFARRIFNTFGLQRFTPHSYYRRICGRRGCTLEQDAAEIHQTIATHGRAVMPAPGIRGGDGWCLNPIVLPTIRAERGLGAKTGQRTNAACTTT